MNKAQLIEIVAEKTDTSKKKTTEIVDSVLDTICEALVNDDKVAFANFGSFEVRTREQRTGKNPQTGETINIESHKTPAFKAGKKLKELVK